MGIYLYLQMSDTITQKEWDSVYEKSLVMAKKCGFYDYSVEKIKNQSVYCLIPSVEKTFKFGTGWRVIGTFPDYKEAEDHFTPKVFGNDSYDGEKYDILRFYRNDNPYEVSEGHHMKSIWCSKTQGEPYHMGLLAIGCMAEQMLGIQATVRGDITYGQCINAAKIASEVLGEEIKPPVTCRLEDLYERIDKFDDIDESEKLNLLKQLYLGTDYNELGEFLKNHFSEECIRKYWSERLKDSQIGTSRFSCDLKDYFDESDDLRRFIEFADFDHKDPEMCIKLIEEILKSSIHIKDKDCSDPFDLKQCSAPYSVNTMLASFILGTFPGSGPNRYIPADEMRKVFTESFGDVINVNEVISNCRENQDDIKEKEREMLDKRIKSVIEENHKYDINNYEDLPFFEPGDTFKPSLLKSIKDSFRIYQKCNERKELKNMMSYKPAEMFKVLAENSKHFLLTFDQWKVIYAVLERDKEAFRRYYPMICVSSNGKFSYLVRELVTNDEFWNYCCKNFTVDDE